MHPWVWLNEPQHGSAVQAVCSIIYTVAAIVAGIYAFQAYRAAKAQAGSAAEQTSIVREQARASAAHAIEEKKRWAEAEQRRAADDESRYQQLVAQEESVRPRWDFSFVNFMRADLNGPGHIAIREFRATNGGKTPALKVRLTIDTSPNRKAERTYIEPDSSIHCEFPLDLAIDFNFLLEFNSVQGSRWHLFFSREGNTWKEQIIDVSRPYAPLHNLRED